MTKKKWIVLKTASGVTRLDIDSIIAMTKTYDTFGKEQWDLHMISGTIFSINQTEYEELMKRMLEDYTKNPRNFTPSYGYESMRHYDNLRPWGEEE